MDGRERGTVEESDGERQGNRDVKVKAKGVNCCEAMKRGNNKGQGMEGKRKTGRAGGFYSFQLGWGVVIVACRPAVFISAPCTHSQSLSHLQNGFSLCPFVSAYGLHP